MNAITSDLPADESCALSGARGSRFRATVLLTLLYSIVAGTLLGFVMTHVAWMMLRLALCSGIGMLLGTILAKTGQSMHCRSLLAMKMLAVMGSLVCIQAAFSTYVWNLFGFTPSGVPLTFFDVFIKPHVVWQVLDSVASSGVITTNGRPMSAPQVWLYWIIEVGATAVTAYIVLKRDYAKLSYCEPCKEWLSGKRQYIFLETPTDKSVQDSIERGDLPALLNLKVLAEPEFPYLRLEYSVCHSCNGRGVYQIFMMRNDSNAANEWVLTPTLSMKIADRPVLAKLIVAQQDLGKRHEAEKAEEVVK